MKSAVVILVLSLSASLSSQARSQSGNEIFLAVGESTTVNGTRVSCGGEKPPLHTQSATSKTCARESMKGECLSFNEHTITGNFCMEAQVCGREAMSGKCVYFNTKAECGEGVCTKSKVCARETMAGDCVYYNENVTCQQR